MATVTTKKPKPLAKLPTKSHAAKEQFTPEIQLSARDSRIVLAALNSPPEPNARLKRAAGRFKKMIAKKP